MNAERFLQYFGHPSSDPGLDELMLESGIGRRLSERDRPVAFIGDAQQSFSLEFTESYEQHFGPTKGEGVMFLAGITLNGADAAEGTGAFEGLAPLGLTVDMSPTQVVECLGPPSDEDDFLGRTIYYYDRVLDGIDLVIRFRKSGDSAEFIRFLPVKSP